MSSKRRDDQDELTRVPLHPLHKRNKRRRELQLIQIHPQIFGSRPRSGFSQLDIFGSLSVDAFENRRCLRFRGHCIDVDEDLDTDV